MIRIKVVAIQYEIWSPLPRSEKEEDGEAEEQQKAKLNQSVKISQKEASEWNKVWNLTAGQAPGQCKVPL